MGRVEALPLRGPVGVEERERPVVPDQRERVDLPAVVGQREDADAVRLQQVHHVRHRALPEAPALPDDLGRRLRLVLLQGGQVGLRQPEAGLHPVRDLDRDPAGRQRGVPAARGGPAQLPEADHLRLEQVDVVRHQELRPDVQRRGQLQHRRPRRRVVRVLVRRERAQRHPGHPGQRAERHRPAVPRQPQPGRGHGSGPPGRRARRAPPPARPGRRAGAGAAGCARPRTPPPRPACRPARTAPGAPDRAPP